MASGTAAAPPPQAAATAASKYNTDHPNEKGYFGRAVHYTNVHTCQMETYYDVNVMDTARGARSLARPGPASRAFCGFR
jgi:hypothetical protein